MVRHRTYISIANPYGSSSFGPLRNTFGDTVSLPRLSGTSSSGAPVSFYVSGLPAGVTFDPFTGVIDGVIAAGDAAISPYSVTVYARDGIDPTQFTFEWDITATINVTAPPLQYNRDGESVNLPIQAQSVSGAPLTYSAQGLPAGLTPDPATGVISGALVTHFSVPTTDYVTVGASDGNDFNSTQFPWNIVPAGASDAVALFNPGSQFNSEGDYVSLSFSSPRRQLAWSALAILGHRSATRLDIHS